MKWFKKVFKAAVMMAFVLAVLVSAIDLFVHHKGRPLCDSQNLGQQAALVLGARVWSNGQMSDIFKDRVDVAVGLYREQKVKKILVSGDHGRKDYDEVDAAKKYLLQQGIPAEDIFLDHAGFDTYDSVYRARDVFKAESLAIVTQGFHIPRALYIADALGVPACGVRADVHEYPGATKRNLREVLADTKAWTDVTFHAGPKFLGPIIPLSGDGQNSWE